ncbi:CHAT domain-containing protein [Micromonospora chersina]|uniref:CHAT domain-containing protein n=1 Tax=Micromonospora chersina TaxID=47854 RepID=UPI0037106A69
MAVEVPPDDSGNPNPFYDRPSRVSVDPPLGRLDCPLHGREELIREIVERPAAGDHGRVQVLCGLGGAGKSHVALEIARRERASGRTVWWVQATRLNAGMQEVVSQLGASESQVDQAWAGLTSATDLVWRYLNQARQPWLLIFDGADEPHFLGPTDGLVADGTGWLRRPEADDGLVLVTTRDGNRSTWGAWSTIHPVRPLEPADGARILRDRAGAQAGDEADARELARELGGLPLALHAAGNYLRSVNTSPAWRGSATATTFASYRDALRRRFRSPITGPVDLDESLGLEILREVDDISLELLNRRGLRHSRPLLNLLACLSVSPVPYDAVLRPTVLNRSPLFEGLTALDRVRVLEGINDLALVDFDVSADVTDPAFSHVLSLHPLMHAMFRDRSDVREEIGEYHRLIMQLLLAATEGQNPDDATSWPNWNVLAPHTVEAVREYLAPQEQKHDPETVRAALELVRLTARYLITIGLPGSAYDIVDPLVRAAGAYDHDQDTPEVLALRHELGRTWLERGRPEIAEAVLRQVIADRTRVLGPRDANTLASRHKLAWTLMEQRRWAEAEAELRQIVTAEDEVRGPEYSDTMIVRQSLALAVLNQGRVAEAKEMLHHILEIRYRNWPLNNQDTWLARNTLARSLEELGQLAEAATELRMGRQGQRQEDREELRRASDHRHLIVPRDLPPRDLLQLHLNQHPEAAAEALKLLAEREGSLDDRARWVLTELLKPAMSEPSDIPRIGSVPGSGRQPERLLVARAPTQVPVGQDLSVEVRIVSEGRSVPPDAAMSRMASLVATDDGTPVTVTVHVPAGLHAEGPLQQTVLLKPAEDPSPIRFGFGARTSGLHRIDVTAWAGGTFLAEVSVEVSADVGGAFRDGQPKAASLGAASARPGEVTMEVRFNGSQYTFQLRSDAALFAPVVESVANTPNASVENAIKELQQLAGGSSRYSATMTREVIRSAGIQLWSEMVPADIRDQFWQIGADMSAFTIATDYDLVPWELLYPLNAGNDAGFLVEQVPVVRRTYGQRRTPTVGLRNPRFVVPTKAPTGVHDEVAAVSAILGTAHGDPITKADELLALINSGEMGVTHFACHNTFSADGSFIDMDGGRFKPALLAEATIRRTLEQNGPLVFINACRSAGAAPTYTKMLGWAQQFMSSGAGAFVGTLWAVRTESSARFATAFYRSLADGATLGIAALAARTEQQEDPLDPTWLAYTVYGDPFATAA